MKKGRTWTKVHAHSIVSETQVHVLPVVLTLLAEAVVATLKLNDLELVLLSCNLCRRQSSELGAEGDERSCTFVVGEDAGLEFFSCLFVGEVADLHLAVSACEGDERH